MFSCLNSLHRFKFFSLVSLVAIFTGGCSTSPILTENFVPTGNIETKIKQESSEKDRLNPSTYTLESFHFPSETELIKEGNFKDEEMYLQNFYVLNRWISKDLSIKQRAQLSKNCQVLVGQFENTFPMNEQTIACAGWWTERKSNKANYNGSGHLSQKISSKITRLSKHPSWNQLKNLSISQVFPYLEFSKKKKKKTYIDNALKTANNCSYKNINSAIILELEKDLPDPNSYQNIESIYGRMQNCLKPNEEPSEKLHLRMGLLRLLQGRTELALESLKKTQLEKNPQESNRSLFWLGAIYQKQNPSTAVNPYWTKLQKENPLSLATIVASAQMNKDPMSDMVEDGQISIQNRIGTQWTKENLEAFIFELLQAKGKTESAVLWLNEVAKINTSKNPNLLLYWSVAQHRYNRFFNSIVMLSRYIKYKEQFLLSPTILKLQFPMAYLNEIASTPSYIDPVFVLSLMRQESAFDEYARSGADARGLMQLLPSTAKAQKKHIHPNDLYDPTINIEIGKIYLEKLFKKYDGRSEYVLAAYNAGGANIDKWIGRVPLDNTLLFCDFIPFKETRTYVAIILRNFYWYSRLLEKQDDSLSKKILSQSKQAKWKPTSIQALLPPFPHHEAIQEEIRKTILGRVFLFGRNNVLGESTTD